MDAICSCFAAWSTWCTLWAVPSALVLILAALHFARHKKKPKWLLRKIEWLRTFYVWLGALAILGGTWAFFLPIAINSGFNKNDDGPVLRQLLIYTTGGLLGAITLGETRRKNDQEHMRQVHAERRSRYAKAVEQLADEKTPIRLGGVYTLAKLVDEWLADEKTLPSEEERHQEGQIIIDSLCAYIRSSFPLAERHDELTLSYEEYQQNRQGNQDLHSPQAIPLPKPKNAKQSREEFIRDKSLFREEQRVRKTVLSEIKKRLNDGKTKNKDGRDEIKPGTWSYFKYDFSNAVFFYDVEFNEVNFSGKKTSFSATKFIRKANFSGATFHETHKATNFSGAHFHKGANFYAAHFHSIANFSVAHFHGDTTFSKAHFHSIANFFGTHFSEDIDPDKITKNTDFSGAYFYGDAIFAGAYFHGNATFSEAHFHEKAMFSGSQFHESTTFFKATFIRHYAFAVTKFSHRINPEDYNFVVSSNSQKITPEDPQPEHNGVKFTIPKGSILFDPDDPFA